MATMERSGTPVDVAVERAAIEAEIEGSTLLTSFAQTVAAAGDMVAHLWLEDGQWRSLTYRQVHDQVRDVALGLGVVGLRPGEFAVIWSRNRSEATVADYAVLHAGVTPVWARAHGIPAASLAELASRPDVLAEVERGVAEANSHLARVEQVRRFRVLPSEWTAETGELTPTLKRRRRMIDDRYAADIEQLY